MAQKKTTKYVRFTEENEWEGEIWHWYIPEAENKEALDSLIAKLKEFDLTDFYHLDDIHLTEQEVDTLVKYANDGTSYMAAHNKVTKPLDVSELEEVTDEEELLDVLNKGGLFN